MTKPEKPLGGKSYGSIGHLLSSRLGPGDHHVHEGQDQICTVMPRKGDRIIVQEKLDGANMSVANIDGFIVPLTRSGYHARDGAYEHLRIFEQYVTEREDQFARLLKPGERVAGEWLALAHGTRYDPRHPYFEPFIVFDIFRDNKRILYDEFRKRTAVVGLRRACLIYNGIGACSPLDAIAILTQPGHSDPKGFHGAIDPVEGAVWRVEREGQVDFLAKYVRQDKTDGKYLPNVSGEASIWHWQPAANDNTQNGADPTQIGVEAA